MSKIMRKFHQDGTQPSPSQIFVFGSNLSGIHGAGAAKAAVTHYGAVLGDGIGLSGRSYAIPTKNHFLAKLGLDEIAQYVEEFAAYTHAHPELEFFVTRVGCGLAGNSDADIAPMFATCNTNCSFAHQWRNYLT